MSIVPSYQSSIWFLPKTMHAPIWKSHIGSAIEHSLRDYPQAIAYSKYQPLRLDK